MRSLFSRLLVAAGLLTSAAPAVSAADQPAPSDALIRQGEYLFRAAGCQGCHTDEKGGGQPLAGGRALVTPFGIFHSPNITPDPVTGIGRWREQDFIGALRQGVSPGGEHYYPSFPYPSYTRLRDEDLRALWAYLRTQPPVARQNQPHALKWFARPRSFLRAWKSLYFTPGAYRPDTSRSVAWNRGAYLAEAAAHCGECHTPRGALGGYQRGMHYAGTREGPEDSVVPNITPDRKTGIGRWRASELVTYLETGLMPDGDSAGDLMAEVIDNGLQYLRKDDLAAIAEYLLSQPPVEHAVRKADREPAAKDPWD